MFENYILTEGTCRNFEEDGCVKGFEMQTLITYYRGIPLSMVHRVAVKVDGIEVPQETIRVSTDEADWFTLAEAETVTTYKWEYGEPLYIRVLLDGGLRKGEHDITLTIYVFPAYYPAPAGGERTRTVLID